MRKWRIKVPVAKAHILWPDDGDVFELWTPDGNFLGWGTLAQCIKCIELRAADGE